MTNPGPMLAKPLKDEPKTSWVLEPKFDGHRVVVQKVGDELAIYSRTFKSQLGKLPHLEQAFAKVPFDFTLDGEIVAINSFVSLGGEEVPIVDFGGTQSVMGSGASEAVRKQNAEGNLTFIVFDCLVAHGEDITSEPDARRREYASVIVDLISTHTDFIMMTPRWSKWDDSYFATLVAAGGEGVMLKNPLGKYHVGTSERLHRSSDWLKMKAVESADVVIMGYEPGKNGFTGYVGAVIFGQRWTQAAEDLFRKNPENKGKPSGNVIGKLAVRSQCSGMNWAERTEFTQNPDKYIDSVMEIKVFGRVGPEKNFRHPNYVCIRTDKTVEECWWE